MDEINYLNTAVEEVVEYGMSASSVSRKYGIPRTTLRRHIKKYKERHGDKNSDIQRDDEIPSDVIEFKSIDGRPLRYRYEDILVKDDKEPLKNGYASYVIDESKSWWTSAVTDSKAPSFAIHPNTKTLDDSEYPCECTLLLFDIHIPHEDKVAVDCALNYAKKQYQIDNIILGGDIMDCEALSKYDKNRNTVAFSVEVQKTRQFLDRLRDDFPEARITYLMGNHEERLEKYILKNAPDLVGVAGGIENVLELEERGIQFVDNRVLKATTNEFFKVGQFTVLHGHEMGICPTVSPAHRFLERAKRNLILGHIHAPDEKVTTCIDGSIIRCYSVGTLGKLNPMYRPFNSWGQGFAIIEHWKTHDIVKNYRIFDGKVY